MITAVLPDSVASQASGLALALLDGMLFRPSNVGRAISDTAPHKTQPQSSQWERSVRAPADEANLEFAPQVHEAVVPASEMLRMDDVPIPRAHASLEQVER